MLRYDEFFSVVYYAAYNKIKIIVTALHFHLGWREEHSA
jgi:hypothetical protein